MSVALPASSAPVGGETHYLDASVTADYYDRSTEELTTRELKVYVMLGQEHKDDLTFIEFTGTEDKVEGFLMEVGIPGEPNVKTREERRKFSDALEEAGERLEKKLAAGDTKRERIDSFLNFDIFIMPPPGGENPLVRLKIHHYRTGQGDSVYLDPEEVSRLVDILREVPVVLEELKKPEELKKQNL